MIQFNLLPDVKKQYIKARRTKRLITTASFMSAAIAIVIVAVLYSFVQFGQKSNIDDLTEDINREVAALQSVEDLERMLTVQTQLELLPGLHQQKPSTSRIFNYLTTLTPSTVTINTLSLDMVSSTMNISGAADSLASINQYADTLKFASYKTDDVENGKPFSDVITRLTRDDEGASYSIDLTFDPLLFDNQTAVTLVVPNAITTRSSLGQSPTGGTNELFQEAPEPEPSETPADDSTGGLE